MSSLATEYPFSPSDYKMMRFNPMETTDILDTYPILGRFASFQDIKKNYTFSEQIFKYICLCYDIKSPAYTEIPDWIKRKSWCGLMSGFKFNDETGIFEKEYHKIMNGESQDVNYAIIDFVRIFNNSDYQLLVSYKDSFERKLRAIASIVKDDKKNDLELEKTRGDLQKQLKNLAFDINELEQKVISDVNPFLREDIYRVINEEVIQSLNLTPEKRAKARMASKGGKAESLSL